MMWPCEWSPLTCTKAIIFQWKSQWCDQCEDWIVGNLVKSWCLDHIREWQLSKVKCSIQGSSWEWEGEGGKMGMDSMILWIKKLIVKVPYSHRSASKHSIRTWSGIWGCRWPRQNTATSTTKFWCDCVFILVAELIIPSSHSVSLPCPPILPPFPHLDSHLSFFFFFSSPSLPHVRDLCNIIFCIMKSRVTLM